MAYKQPPTPEQIAKMRKWSRDWARRNPHKTHGNRKHEAGRIAEYRKNRLRKFRLTADQLYVMYVDQYGACAICETPLKDEFSGFIDHDHDTGEVRGLLCNGCNTGLGMFRESCTALLKAIQYLTDRRS